MDKKNIILMILGAFLVITGTAYYILVVRYDRMPPKVIYEKAIDEEKVRGVNLKIYLPDNDLKKLEERYFSVEAGENGAMEAEKIFDILKSEMSYKFQYESESGNIEEAPFLDEGVKLLNEYVDGEDMYLNFNYKFKENMKTPHQELLIIYSIVNTLTEFQDIQRIKILVNNKEIEKLNFYKLSKFYEKNLEI